MEALRKEATGENVEGGVDLAERCCGVSADCSKIPENRLTRLFSSKIRTAIGSQFVGEKLSTALLFHREKCVFEASSGGR